MSLMLEPETASELRECGCAGLAKSGYVCHCLKLTADDIRETVSDLEQPTVRCVMRMTGAGTGCTACHRRIRQLLVDRVEPADQCPPSPPPTCVIR